MTPIILKHLNSGHPPVPKLTESFPEPPNVPPDPAALGPLSAGDDLWQQHIQSRASGVHRHSHPDQPRNGYRAGTPDASVCLQNHAVTFVQQ